MISPYRLTLSCEDKPGIIAEVGVFIASHGGNITESHQFNDLASGLFHMRCVIDPANMAMSIDDFKQLFSVVAERFAMNFRITDTGKKTKVLFMVSKFDHCLKDILYRWKSGELDFDIPCVISNHPDMQEYVEWFGLEYKYVPVPKDDEGKQQAFDQTSKIIDEYQPDTIVLARYMQIFPPWMCVKYQHQVINIHHSFLPSFMGASPYHQALERGVKLIGATCHYVTENLDAGPIIDQDIVRVHHYHNVEDLKRLGKDVEKTVLARGLRNHLQERVLVHNNKTIIFG